MNYTIEAWVKPTQPSTWIRVIWAKHRASVNWPQGGWELMYNPSDSLNTETGPSAAGALPVGAWAHVAVTYNNSMGTKCTWVNGTSRVCGSVAATTGANTFPVTLGNEDQGIAATYFAGYIDEVRVSNVTRYTASFTPQKRFTTDTNTLALWHFDEGSGTTTSGEFGGMTGTLANATWSTDAP